MPFKSVDASPIPVSVLQDSTFHMLLPAHTLLAGLIHTCGFEYQNLFADDAQLQPKHSSGQTLHLLFSKVSQIQRVPR